MSNYTITADSTPNLDDWGWDDYWDAQDWMYWHSLMVDKYGLEWANRTFIQAYHSASFGADSYDWRTFNSDFRQYADENGFLDALYDGVLGVITQPIGGAIEIGENLGEGISNVSEGVKKSSELISYLLPLLLLFVVVIGGFYVYKKHLA